MSVKHASKSVLEALPYSRPSNYVCRQCRKGVHPLQTVAQQRQFTSSSDRGQDLPFAEKVRRKLWKGKPPGPENVDDLYGGPGAIETMIKERRERRTRVEPSRTPTANAPEQQAQEQPSDFVEPVQKPRGNPRVEEGRPVFDEPKEFETVQATESYAQTPGEFVSTSPDSEYRPATDWTGLPAIGHKGHWREMSARGQDEYHSWLESPVRPEWSFSELTSLIHQAIVECWVCKGNEPGQNLLFKINSNSPVSIDELEKTTLIITPEGDIRTTSPITTWEVSEHLQHEDYPPTEPVQPDMEIEEAILSRNEPIATPLTPRLLYSPADTAFLDSVLNLTNPLTFRILKRFSYLINHPIPDPYLSNFTSPDPSLRTIRHFLTLIAEKTKHKPANVAEQLINNETLTLQKNLLVLGRRETPIDKEKELGRWKVIEEELRARGLPVTGRAEVQR